MTFSVSIPNYELKKIKILYVSLDSERIPTKISILLNMGANVSKIKSILKEKFLAQKVIVALYLNNMFKGIISDTTEVSEISERTLIAFEAPIDENFHLIPLLISKSSEKRFLSSASNAMVTYVRLLFIDLKSSLHDMHVEISKYFKSIIEVNLGKDLENGVTKVYDTNPPLYSLNIINQSKKSSGYFSSSKLACDYCGSRSCENCSLPITEEKTLKDLLDNRPNSEGPFALEIIWNSKTKGIDRLNKLIEDDNTIHDSQIKRNSSVTLYECLEHACKSEKLDEGNKWFCPSCKNHVQATKSYQIYRTPQILILHLLRFKSRSYWTDKLSTFVDFPLEGLDLSTYILGSKENPVYDLYAVSNHYGSLGGGHYTAFVKNSRCESWLEMDDSHVSTVKSDKVISPAAYILFYKRRE